jgi:hypothetical protein
MEELLEDPLLPDVLLELVGVDELGLLVESSPHEGA